jgi:hypothetical protein
MNGWRCLKILSNQEESNILNKKALLWLLAYSPKSRWGQRRFSHPIFQIYSQVSRILLGHWLDKGDCQHLQGLNEYLASISGWSQWFDAFLSLSVYHPTWNKSTRFEAWLRHLEQNCHSQETV